MEIDKKNIRGSPYVGIFCVVTEKFGLFPKTIDRHEIEKLSDFFGVEAIPATIAGTSLLGVLATANSHGIVVSGVAEEKEISELEGLGLNVAVVDNIAAVGNLVRANDNGGVCAKIFSKEAKSGMETALKVELRAMKIADTDLAGSCIVATNRGFLANPGVSKESFAELRKIFGVDGALTTANYGDACVGNSIVANSRAAIVGEQTSGFELLRIDEGLMGR
ncbi:MAG: translation initiation factor IF-6 [Candidatus Diapherotrites archaeon]|nr:translation initiation factor IF-6 [Candidatus Diapherotrites archaeon]